MPIERQAGGDATGNAQRVPLAKMVLYYNTHLAYFLMVQLLQELGCWRSSPAHGLDRAHLWFLRTVRKLDRIMQR